MFAALVCATMIYAQRIDVTETNGTFGKETHPALATKVLFTDAKTVTKEFVNLIKGYKPENLTVKKGVIFADNALVPTLSENVIDIFATISQQKGSDVVDLVVAFYIGGNIYVTSSQAPSQYPTAYEMIKNFANNLTEKNHAAMLKTAGKVLAKEEKKLASLEKKDASYQKSIDSDKKSIEKLQKNISKNESKQANVKSDIDNQRVVVREKKDAYKRIEKL